MGVENQFKTELLILSLIVLGLVFRPITVSGQQMKGKLRFSSINEVGMLIGGKGEAVMLQTINGIQKDKWFAGVGSGFDFYGLRSIPLFLSGRRDFFGHRSTPFIYANGGANFAWINTDQKTQLGIHSTSPGYYYDLGAGWKLSGKNGPGFILSAGYTVKQVKYKTPTYTIFAPPQPEGDTYFHYNHLFRRVVVKIGLQL